jgi:mannose/fructose/N-acetylgalactosamine-specific phosphotransferase system component IIB
MLNDVPTQVESCSTPREVWTLLEQTYASHLKVRVVNTQMALATIQKGNMTISEYIAKMKSLADEMASAKKPLKMKNLSRTSWHVSTSTTTLFVLAMVARVEPISVGKLYAQFLNFEARWELTQGGQQASANAT